MSCCNYDNCYQANNCYNPCSCIVPVIPSAPTTNFVNAISITDRIIEANAAIPFDTNIAINGLDITHIAGNSNFTIKKEGTYKIDLIGVVYTETILETSIAIAQNNIVLSGTKVIQSITKPLEKVNLKTQVFITLQRDEIAEITVINSNSVNQNIESANISIVKLA